MAQIENTIIDLVKLITERIKTDILRDNENSTKLLDKVFNAYNDFQTDERNGVDYIFDIDNPGDVIECIRAGLVAKDIAHIYNESQTNTTRYFFYHRENHPKPELMTWEQFRDLLLDELEHVLYAVIAYPWVESYSIIYGEYIRDYMVNHCLI